MKRLRFASSLTSVYQTPTLHHRLRKRRTFSFYSLYFMLFSCGGIVSRRKQDGELERENPCQLFDQIFKATCSFVSRKNPAMSKHINPLNFFSSVTLYPPFGCYIDAMTVRIPLQRPWNHSHSVRDVRVLTCSLLFQTSVCILWQNAFVSCMFEGLI